MSLTFLCLQMLSLHSHCFVSPPIVPYIRTYVRIAMLPSQYWGCQDHCCSSCTQEHNKAAETHSAVFFGLVGQGGRETGWRKIGLCLLLLVTKHYLNKLLNTDTCTKLSHSVSDLLLALWECCKDRLVPLLHRFKHLPKWEEENSFCLPTHANVDVYPCVPLIHSLLSCIQVVCVVKWEGAMSSVSSGLGLFTGMQLCFKCSS